MCACLCASAHACMRTCTHGYLASAYTRSGCQIKQEGHHQRRGSARETDTCGYPFQLAHFCLPISGPLEAARHRSLPRGGPLAAAGGRDGHRRLCARFARARACACACACVWARGPVGLWACGPVGLWACGPVGLWACGPVGLWACGPVGLWACAC